MDVKLIKTRSNILAMHSAWHGFHDALRDSRMCGSRVRDEVGCVVVECVMKYDVW